MTCGVRRVLDKSKLDFWTELDIAGLYQIELLIEHGMKTEEDVDKWIDEHFEEIKADFKFSLLAIHMGLTQNPDTKEWVPEVENKMVSIYELEDRRKKT